MKSQGFIGERGERKAMSHLKKQLTILLLIRDQRPGQILRRCLGLLQHFIDLPEKYLSYFADPIISALNIVAPSLAPFDVQLLHTVRQALSRRNRYALSAAIGDLPALEEINRMLETAEKSADSFNSSPHPLGQYSDLVQGSTATKSVNDVLPAPVPPHPKASSPPPSALAVAASNDEGAITEVEVPSLPAAEQLSDSLLRLAESRASSALAQAAGNADHLLHKKAERAAGVRGEQVDRFCVDLDRRLFLSHVLMGTLADRGSLGGDERKEMFEAKGVDTLPDLSDQAVSDSEEDPQKSIADEYERVMEHSRPPSAMRSVIPGSLLRAPQAAES